MKIKFPDKWNKYKLEELLSYEQPTQYIVHSTDYNESYTTPVLTAGKSFVIGYTNETDGIYTKVPVIIFDDFTTDTQYVSFHFKVKSSAMKILTANPDLAIPKFLYYIMQIIDCEHSTHKRYWISKYSLIDVKIPSLPEQKCIVEKIDELFSNLDAAEAELLISQKKLDIYRTSLLTLASEGFPLTEKNSTLSSWKRVKIENILSDSDKGMTTGPFGTMLPKKDHRKEGIPVLGIENIGNGIFVDGNKIFIDIEKARELKSFQVAPDDIIISRSGTVGKLCVVPSYVGEAYLSTNLIRIKLNKKKIIPQFFVYFFLSKGIVWEQIKELCKGSTRPFLNQTILKSIDFPLPSLDDQIRILNIIESKFSICDVLQKQIAESIIKSKALRYSILKQAFEGGLV